MRGTHLRLLVVLAVIVLGYGAMRASGQGGGQRVREPRLLSFYLTQPHGATHGFDLDDRYLYGCATTLQTKAANHQVLIVDYGDPRHPALVSTVHIRGQYLDETYAPQDQKTLDGSPQHVWCHEINYFDDRIYVAWRDAGMVIVDVTDRAGPRIVSRLDYVPPFNGGRLGATHTVAPVTVDPAKQPTLAVLTDEIIACPPGFGRIVDISDLANPQVLSTLRIPQVTDNYDFAAGTWRCPENGEYVHHPWFDYRSPSLLYTAWINQGLRAWDISDPFLPREVGYYLSPRYPGRFPNRQVREVYQDRDTGLLFMADANGAGITVLRWTGPIPPHPPIPGAR